MNPEPYKGIEVLSSYEFYKMKFKYSLIIVSMVLMFLGCASNNEQIKKNQPIKAKTNDEIPLSPELKENPESVFHVKIKELRQQLIMNGVPGEWFDKQMQNETFQIHSNINQYFQKSAEKQTDHDKKYDTPWYFKRIGVDAKIEKGKPFIEKHIVMFNRAEARHGIHKELIAAIIGIETNFADQQQRGKFYAFNSLVSQYIFTNRINFAVREITALYKFSQMTGHPPQYFTSSYAGAIGWGQFIPSSLMAFFIDSNSLDDDIDPFSIEDTIFSVENYLYKNKLSGENIDDYDSKYKAIFAYNHSDVYVKAVLYIYEGLRNYFSSEKSDVRAEK
jgi:membrane-bound lytic murein transglycosylase B